jgi:hypothetical protein
MVARHYGASCGAGGESGTRLTLRTEVLGAEDIIIILDGIAIEFPVIISIHWASSYGFFLRQAI